MRRQRCWSVALALATAAVLAAPGQASASSFTVLYTFASGQAVSPSISVARGLTLYGVDPAAGSGNIFRINPSRTYTRLYTFGGGADGAQPNARLAMDGKGDIFGTTLSGGGAGQGTVFRLSAPTRTLTTLHSFQGSPDGAAPRDGLAMTKAGTLFGTASMGNIAPGNGEVFSITPAGAMSVVYQFLSSEDGHCPFSGVALGPGGALYGTTVGFGFGGQPNGSVFALQQHPAAQVTTLHPFGNGADGEYPQITPTLDHAGNVYGVSNTQDGAAFAGSVWTIPSAGGFSVLHSFTGGADGYQPNGPLKLGPGGLLYGATAGGGSGYGVVFSISPSGQFAVLHAFTGGADGSGPTGQLAIDASGNIYGGTASGTIFEIMP